MSGPPGSGGAPASGGPVSGGPVGAGIVVGLWATVTAEVTEADTALALGSGDVPVLGTPRLLGLAEAASVAALAPHLPAGQTSVGAAVSLEHKRPSLVGSPIEMRAELTGVDGRKLTFMFIAYGAGTGDDAVIGAGMLERVLVKTDRFLAGAAGANETRPPSATATSTDS
jgi:predicted thioesterase